MTPGSSAAPAPLRWNLHCTKLSCIHFRLLPVALCFELWCVSELVPSSGTCAMQCASHLQAGPRQGRASHAGRVATPQSWLAVFNGYRYQRNSIMPPLPPTRCGTRPPSCALPRPAAGPASVSGSAGDTHSSTGRYRYLRCSGYHRGVCAAASTLAVASAARTAVTNNCNDRARCWQFNNAAWRDGHNCSHTRTHVPVPVL